MTLPRHARVVLIGDLLAPLADIQAAVGRLAAVPVTGHVLQVLDPAEAMLPYTGRVRFEGLRPGLQTLIPRVEGCARPMRERLAEQQTGLAAICAAAGFGFAIHRTDHPPETALLALYTALAPQTGHAPRADDDLHRSLGAAGAGGAAGAVVAAAGDPAGPAARDFPGRAAADRAQPDGRDAGAHALVAAAAAHAGGRRWSSSALARPVLDAGGSLPGSGPLLLVVDDGWAAAADWPRRMTAAGRGAGPRRARRPHGRPARRPPPPRPAPPPAVTPAMPVPEARTRLAALQPQALAGRPGRRHGGAARLDRGKGAVLFIADGTTGGAGWDGFAAALAAVGPVAVLRDAVPAARLLLPPRSEADRLVARIAQAPRDLPAEAAVLAQSGDGRTLARATASFAAGGRGRGADRRCRRNCATGWAGWCWKASLGRRGAAAGRALAPPPGRAARRRHRRPPTRR